jgi:transcriptional regulator with GAF, ATPase, and Fis domain
MNIARPFWGRPRDCAPVGPHFERYGIAGNSSRLDEMIRSIDLVAATRSTVLITGETGAGKELVARAVHARSAERAMPFVKINCAAIPDTLLESELFGHVRGAFTGATNARRGKFAQAHGGSILLDEIGAMGAPLQAKLLRVLQEREFEALGSERVERIDVRVIAATNRDLRRMVSAGAFQEDLYYRLHVVPIVVPSLRERIEDVAALAHHFVSKHASRCEKRVDGIDEDAIEALKEHDWPGNVRELENIIERAVVLTTGPTITRDAISFDAAPSAERVGVPSMKLRDNVAWAEQETIRRAMRRAPVKCRAAALMGISPRALSHYLAKYPSLDV